jgi:hemerythrin
MLFEWTSGYSVGVPAMDSQHRKLIGYMNGFHEFHGAGRLREAQSALASLLRYTRIHFLEEEVLMERHRYPDLAGHRAAHRQLLVIAEKLARAYMQDPISRNAENMGNYLKVWLAHHILGMDQRYAPFLSEGEGKPALGVGKVP